LSKKVNAFYRDDPFLRNSITSNEHAYAHELSEEMHRVYP